MTFDSEVEARRVCERIEALLDQGIVAGLGNIYVCEALYRAGVSPLRAGGKVKRREIEALVPAIVEVLEESIAAGGSTIRDYAQPNGELGYFAANWRVYGREGEACPCGGTVTRIAQGGRHLHNVDNRQAAEKTRVVAGLAAHPPVARRVAGD